MNRNGLARVLARKTKLTVQQADKLIAAFGEIVSDALELGEKIVYSNFGTFYTVHYPSKVIYHPVLGAQKKMVMLPTDVAKWMPSNNIKAMVDSGKIQGSATSFGATKKFQQYQIKNGMPLHKSEEIESDPLMVKIPISINRKNIQPAGDTPVTNNSIGSEYRTSGSQIKIETKTTQQAVPEIPDLPKEELQKNANFWDSLFRKAATESTGKPKEPVIEFQKEPLDDSPKTVQPRTKREVSYSDLSQTTVPKEIIQLIPKKVAQKYRIVPVEKTALGLAVGMADPGDIETIEMVKKMVGMKILPHLTSESDIGHILDQYQDFETEVKEVVGGVSEELGQDKTENADGAASAINNAPVARIVSSLLKRAIRDKASDIHIEPSEKEVAVRFRIDGVLHKKVTLPKDIQSAVISRIKMLSNLKIDEQRLPQDGRFGLNIDERRIDFRVSTMPIADGEKVVIRVFDKVTKVKSIEELGFRDRDKNVISNNSAKSHGMILVTGPTGSGKTTTLYALISKIYSEGINIITLEDPIEYQIPGINQSQVNTDIDYTFASGLRSILRQDPDVVMIGEIRDNETAKMVVQAALTGHVVLSTLHTNDSAGAISRLLNMGVEPFLLNSSLNVIIAQRLARRICPSCRQQIQLDPAESKTVMDEIAKLPESERPALKQPLVFYSGKGCKNCNDTGYKGRIGLYEVLEMSPKIKELTAQRASGADIQTCAIAEGMTLMIQDGVLKALAGLITIEEVWRATKE